MTSNLQKQYVYELAQGQLIGFWYLPNTVKVIKDAKIRNRYNQVPHLTRDFCVKRPLEIIETKILMTNGSLMKVRSIAECSKGRGAFCNTFDLHSAIIFPENQFSVFRVVVLHRYYSMLAGETQTRLCKQTINLVRALASSTLNE